MKNIITEMKKNNREELFEKAYQGSWYTLTGVNGNLKEWVEVYSKMLVEKGIGIPTEFITFKGSDMNEYYGLFGSVAYPSTMQFLAFSLDGLEIYGLAAFKLWAGDRWFDDIVDNNEDHLENMQNNLV